MKSLDQRAQMQPTHGIHCILPASLLTEAAQSPIFIGPQGRGNTGLAHGLGHLEWLLHGLVLLGVTLHAVLCAF